jgi:hypothetical protein
MILLVWAFGCAIGITESRDYCQTFGCGLDAVSLLQMAHELTSQEAVDLASTLATPRINRESGGVRDASSTSWNLSSWKYYHVGKTGGGTVEDRQEQLELDLKQCHPRPCFWDDTLNAFISVRDPIDLFESAFNWRCTVLCAPNESDRNQRLGIPPRILGSPSNGELTPEFNEDHCRLRPSESYILNVKYARNVSMLAQSLCSMDEKIQKEAQDDLNHIEHIKVPQSKWISMLKQKERVVAFVLELGFDFVQQIDAGFAWALNQEGVEVSPDQFPQHAADDDRRHTSKTGESFPHLTEAATRCLAKHFSEDYASLDWLRTTACHGIESQTCKAALKSIRDRRRVFLQ